MKNRYFIVTKVVLLWCWVDVYGVNNIDFNSLLTPAPHTTLSTTPLPSPVNVSSLLTAQPIVKKIQPIQPLHLSLQAILEKQANPEYQAALNILSDVEIKNSYRDDLVFIQFFFLDCQTKILHKYSLAAFQANKSIHQPMDVTGMLQKITPPSTTKHDAITTLSDLTGILQKESTKTVTPSGGYKINIDLDAVLQKKSVSKPSRTVHKSSIDVAGLLTSEQAT